MASAASTDPAHMARCAVMGAGETLDAAAVARLFAAAEVEVTSGRLPACQVAVARGDALEAAAFGAGPDARYLVFSLTKALVAGATWVLFGQGSLTPATRVVDLIPEFGTHGKDAVTVEHLLAHTAGFPDALLAPAEGATAAGRLAAFATWRLDWEPGSQTAYHATSAHWVLAELIERVGGMDYRAFVALHVLEPLGLRRWQLGVPQDQRSDILDVVIVGDQGAPARAPATSDPGYAFLLRFNDPAVREVGVPGAGAVADAVDVVRYFQALLGRDERVWDPDVVREATSVIRNRLIDPPTKVPANRTLGLKVAGDDGHAELRGVGRAAGPRTFVNGAAAGQVAWADPDTGLAFAFVTNGCADDVATSFARTSRLSTLAARCAGAGTPA